jgi:hypothetical protein
MPLIARGLARPHLGIGEGDLHRIQLRHDFGELGGCQAVGEPGQLSTRDVEIDQHARELGRGHGHRLGRHLRIDVMASDEQVDHVEIGLGLAVEAGHAAVFDLKAGLRIVRAGEGGEAVLGILDRKAVEAQRTLVPIGESAPTIGAARSRAVVHLPPSRLAAILDPLWRPCHDSV